MFLTLTIHNPYGAPKKFVNVKKKCFILKSLRHIRALRSQRKTRLKKSFFKKEKVKYTQERVEGKLGGSKTRLTESARSGQGHARKLGGL